MLIDELLRGSSSGLMIIFAKRFGGRGLQPPCLRLGACLRLQQCNNSTCKTFQILLVVWIWPTVVYGKDRIDWIVCSTNVSPHNVYSSLLDRRGWAVQLNCAKAGTANLFPKASRHDRYGQDCDRSLSLRAWIHQQLTRFTSHTKTAAILLNRIAYKVISR